MIDGRAVSVPLVIEEPVEPVLARLGRTEDIRFSPSNRRLAVAGFGKSRCLLLDVEIHRTAASATLGITGYLQIESAALSEPHGFDFVDEHTLVVANRRGFVSLFRLPERAGVERTIELSPFRMVHRASPWRRIHSPGSVCVTRADAETCEILVCNNYRHRITRHVVGLARTSVRNKILLDRGLDIPDGIALSPDKAWIAVSNHNTHTVLIFDNRSALGRHSAAIGTLHGVSYPHGLRFSPDGRRLFVADAGSPHVLVYDAKDGDWSGERNSSLSIVVMSQEIFLKGRNNPQEGGTKGLDIDASGRLLVVTCEEQAIACFDIARLPSEDAPGRLPSGCGPEVLRPAHAADNPLNITAATAVASPPSQ